MALKLSYQIQKVSKYADMLECLQTQNLKVSTGFRTEKTLCCVFKTQVLGVSHKT